MTSRTPTVVIGRRGLAGIAVVALGALAGCGAHSNAAAVGASPTADTSPRTVASTQSGTSRSTAGVAIDRRITREAQLRLTDFPPGWTSSPSPVSTGANCPPIRGARAAVSAHGRSRQFSRGSAVTANSVAYIYADTASATHWFAQLSSRHTRSCLVRVLRASVLAQIHAQGARLDSVTASRLTIPVVGDQHAGDRIVVRLSAGTFRGHAVVDVIFVRAGRGLEVFVMNRVGRPFDRPLEGELVGAVVERLAASVAAP